MYYSQTFMVFDLKSFKHEYVKEQSTSPKTNVNIY